MLHISVQNLFQLQNLLQVFSLPSAILLYQNILYIPFDSPGNVVNILWLDDCMQVVLKNSCEVVLQLTASEVRKNLLPVWSILRSTNNTCVRTMSPAQSMCVSMMCKDRYCVIDALART